jgi:hypothetical protein
MGSQSFELAGGYRATEQTSQVSHRRVVTGHDPDGRAVFVSDEIIEPVTPSLTPGSEFVKVWGGDEAPSFPAETVPPGALQFFPPVGGFRFYIITSPPGGAAALPRIVDREQALAEIEQDLPGMVGHMEADNPGMHTTATADFEIMLSGEIVLELDDGAEKVLRPGDTIIQNGTRHRWHNRTDQPATFAVFIVGAHHAGPIVGR